MRSDEPTPSQDTVYFDGVCNLCNAGVQFIIDRDRKRRFRFASLQSEYAKERLTLFGLQPEKLNSIILEREGRFYTESTAALHIARDLGMPWASAVLLLAIPRGARDWIYRLIAKNRYRWFGRKDQCRIPSPETRDRFLG